MSFVRASFVVLFVAGCGGELELDAGSTDASIDAHSIDASSMDAGSMDAGSMDAGSMDAGSMDAGSMDDGSFDAGAIDAGAIDAGAFDAGAFDAGLDAARAMDAGPIDAGENDAGTYDAGFDAGPPLCTTFATGVSHGPVPIAELSGLAVSRRNTGLIYAHNDSGGAASVYALDEDNAILRARIDLTGATNVDWEDIAVGPELDGTVYVWVGDVGDNEARTGGTPRSSIVVYRFEEPLLDPSGSTTVSVPVEALTFTYPDRPHDCEAIAVDPGTGDLYLLTKENSTTASLFVSRAPQVASRTLELVRTVTTIGRAVGMDISPGGRGLLVRTGTVELWIRGPAETWNDALARASRVLSIRSEPQGESVAWARDGRGYWTASEGLNQPLYFYAPLDASCIAY